MDINCTQWVIRKKETMELGYVRKEGVGGEVVGECVQNTSSVHTKLSKNKHRLNRREAKKQT